MEPSCMCYKNPQQEFITSILNSMKRTSIGKSLKGNDIVHRYHSTAINEQIHFDISTQAFNLHWSLYGDKIIASKTMLNFWLKVLERASKFPPWHRLFYAATEMFTHPKSGLCFQESLKDDSNKAILKLLTVPFSHFTKYFTPIKLPIVQAPNDQKDDSIRLVLGFLEAATKLYTLTDYYEKQFSEMWDLVTSLEVTEKKYVPQVCDFFKNIIRDYPENIDLIEFSDTPIFSILIENIALDLIHLSINNSEVCLKVIASFLNTYHGSFIDVENVVTKYSMEIGQLLVNFMMNEHFENDVGEFNHGYLQIFIRYCINFEADPDDSRNEFKVTRCREIFEQEILGEENEELKEKLESDFSVSTLEEIMDKFEVVREDEKQKAETQFSDLTIQQDATGIDDQEIVSSDNDLETKTEDTIILRPTQNQDDQAVGQKETMLPTLSDTTPDVIELEEENMSTGSDEAALVDSEREAYEISIQTSLQNLSTDSPRKEEPGPEKLEPKKAISRLFVVF